MRDAICLATTDDAAEMSRVVVSAWHESNARDPDVLEAFKATGPGWQTRMHDVLAEAARKMTAA